VVAMFVATSAVQVTKELDLSTAEQRCAVHFHTPGDEVEIIEEALSSTGQRRGRTSLGWVSLVSTRGKVLFRRGSPLIEDSEERGGDSSGGGTSSAGVEGGEPGPALQSGAQGVRSDATAVQPGIEGSLGNGDVAIRPQPASPPTVPCKRAGRQPAPTRTASSEGLPILPPSPAQGDKGKVTLADMPGSLPGYRVIASTQPPAQTTAMINSESTATLPNSSTASFPGDGGASLPRQDAAELEQQQQTEEEQAQEQEEPPLGAGTYVRMIHAFNADTFGAGHWREEHDLHLELGDVVHPAQLTKHPAQLTEISRPTDRSTPPN
jgi:hypothetical protein